MTDTTNSNREVRHWTSVGQWEFENCQKQGFKTRSWDSESSAGWVFEAFVSDQDVCDVMERG